MVVIKSMLRNCAPVLLYHAAYRVVPQDIRENLHNVHPTTIHDQLSYLKKSTRIVPVDELAGLANANGVAAITLDDGYKCVIDNLYDIFLDLDIPFTIFINSSSMENKVFWRDKVRYVINNNLVQECESYLQHTRPVENLPFYRYTKHPANSSRVVDEELDNFFRLKNIALDSKNYCFDDLSYFKSNPRISYGNHTHNHYVLSSLAVAEQVDEIHRTRQFLESLQNVQVSEVFSLPFGGPLDYNEDTLQVLRDMGYRTVLLSRQRLNFSLRKELGLTLVERFMPKDGNLPLLLARLQFS
jgi:peptidoglycan/xylan/chitin deacetylase (PgdA/CDA1 family)